MGRMGGGQRGYTPAGVGYCRIGCGYGDKRVQEIKPKKDKLNRLLVFVFKLGWAHEMHGDIVSRPNFALFDLNKIV